MKKKTGERLNANVYDVSMFEHLHRYIMAAKFCVEKRVLDIACGEGYGSAILAKTANSVIGADINAEAVQQANKKYTAQNLHFTVGSATRLDFADNSFDVVISFETLEHLKEHSQMLCELKRVLSSNGVLIISTPDKFIYSDRKNYQNPFHVKELYRWDFEALVKKHFQYVSLYGQRTFFASQIFTDSFNDAEYYTGDFSGITQRSPEAEYLIAVCSDGPFIKPNTSLFYDTEFPAKVEHKLKNSTRYKFGNLLLNPIQVIKNSLRKRSHPRPSNQQT
jgi:ubiquinone/menaquinone biosynthesis C-methylase UbiE